MYFTFQFHFFLDNIYIAPQATMEIVQQLFYCGQPKVCFFNIFLDDQI